MNIAAARAEALRALRPPPDIALGDWIERNIYLPAGTSAMPGRMRLWPYTRNLVEAIADPEIRIVTFKKSARIGATELMNAVTAHFVANDVTSIVSVQPRADDARDHAVNIEKLFENSPVLRGLLTDDADPNGRSTLLNKRFLGGQLLFRAATSPAAARRITARVVLQDEIDSYLPSDEGLVSDLFAMRSQTFSDSKQIYASTPILEGGPIDALYQRSDQRVYEVLCPSCNEHSELLWADVRWKEGDPDSAHWVCPLNGCVIPEREKAQMVEKGRWRITKPEVKDHAGFRINSLISPHHAARWPNLVRQFLEAKKNPETLRPFLNTVLGIGWRPEGETLDEHELFNRKEAFSLEAIPDDVLWLTLGADVQADRIEAVVVGHSESCWLVMDHVVFHGATDSDAPWRELDALLRKRWPHPLGGTIGIDASIIDSGFQSDLVYGFTRPRFGLRCVSGKGMNGFSRAYAEKSHSVQGLWIIGVDAIKQALHTRLTRNEGVRFSATLSPVFFDQLTSERHVLRYVAGKPEERFARIPGKNAECLDASVYAIAARRIINLDEATRRQHLSSAAAPLKPKAVIRSTWMSR